MEYLNPMLQKIYVGLALLLFLISFFLGIDRFFHHKSSRFTLHNITSSQRYSSEWEIPKLPVEEQQMLDQILNQKFTYYSKGSQSYVFISEDKKFILKFLKQEKLRPKSWLAYIPVSFNPYHREYLFKQEKCRSTFSACKTAFLELKKESGLIYVHLNNARDLNKKITIFDKNGERHVVDIDKTCFYVQKRAQLIYSRISELMHNHDIEGAKRIICSVFSLIDYLGKKGVFDNDPILRKNFGLIDDIAVQIDIGKLRIDPLRQQTLEYKQEVGSITNSFKLWLEKNYPDLSEHFECCLREVQSQSKGGVVDNSLSLFLDKKSDFRTVCLSPFVQSFSSL
jgi:hypothetical protein